MSVYFKAFKLLTKAYSYIPYKMLDGYALPPLQVGLDLTYRCNLRCSMCFFLRNEFDKVLQEKKREELTTEQWKSIISQFRRFQILTFSGGEVFARKDLMELLEHAKKKNIFSVVTNGSMITKETAARLVELAPNSIFGTGLLEVGISVEQPTDAHDDITKMKGSFKKTMAAVEEIIMNREKQKKRFPQVTLRVVMMRENVRNLVDIFEMAEKYRVDVCNFSVIYTTAAVDRVAPANKDSYLENTAPVPEIEKDVLTRSLEELAERAKSSCVTLRITPENVPISEIIGHYQNIINLDDYRCYSPWFRALISAYGEFIPCAEYIVGSAIDEKFSVLWNSEKTKLFRRKVKKGLFPNCPGCCSLVYHKHSQN